MPSHHVRQVPSPVCIKGGKALPDCIRLVLSLTPKIPQIVNGKDRRCRPITRGRDHLPG